MTLRCFLPQSLAIDQALVLPDALYHYAVRVRRLQVGDALVVFNGLVAGEYRGQLQEITRKAATVRLDEFVPKNTRSPLQITLVQGITRGDKMDLIVQKATELGVAAIQPLFTQYGTTSWDADQIARKTLRWQQILVSACEQSGRCDVPMLHPPRSLPDWLATAPPFAGRCLLDPLGTERWRQLTLPTEAERSVALLIGAEGGWHPHEEQQARDHGFMGIRLGPRVLRTETAGLTAIAVLQAQWGDLA